MRLKTSLFSCLLAGALICGSCKKDIPFVKHCTRYYSEADMHGCSIATYIYNGRFYEYPCFNPNNTAEFVYVEDHSQLVRFNIHTKQKTVLVDGLKTLLSPDWGRSGWITFSAGWKIWKVREDGSGLTQLSFTPRDLYPEFNVSGDRIIYARNMEYSVFELERDPSLRDQYKMMIIDLEGNAVDSFCRGFQSDRCYPWDVCAWSREDWVAAEYGPNNDLTTYGIAIYDLKGNELDIPYKLKNSDFKRGSPFIYDIEWHPTSGSIYFMDGEGIKCLRLGNDKVEWIKKSCADEYYEGFSISADGEHIVAVKGEASKDKSTCTITSELYLVRMKIDGSNEERIDIP